MNRAAMKGLGIVAVTSVAAIASGCEQFEPKGMSGAPAPNATAPTADPADVFAPAQMRIHPLTRWGPVERGRRTIEAHVEFFDRWGDSVKALGVFRFELVPIGESGIGSGSARREEREERPIARWEVDLTDADLNSRSYFDHVTRTYLIALAVDPEVAVDRRLRLRATFTTPRGQTLRVDHELHP